MKKRKDKKIKEKTKKGEKMIVPIRCFSCGKVIAGVHQEFTERINKGENAGKVLDELKIKKYCCRKTL